MWWLTPMDYTLKLSKPSTGDVIDPSTYRRLVGRLLYLINTWPDLNYVVGKLSQYLDCPSDAHHQAVRKVLRYIPGTVSCLKLILSYKLLTHSLQFCWLRLGGMLGDKKINLRLLLLPRINFDFLEKQKATYCHLFPLQKLSIEHWLMLHVRRRGWVTCSLISS